MGPFPLPWIHPCNASRTTIEERLQLTTFKMQGPYTSTPFIATFCVGEHAQSSIDITILHVFYVAISV